MEGLVISRPFGFKHNIHVDYDSESGFSGLPPEWESLLKQSGLSKEQVLANPDDAMAALNYVTTGNKVERKQGCPRLVDFLSSEDPTKVFGKLVKLDEGSSGVVYKGIHQKTNMKVCLRVNTVFHLLMFNCL